MKREGKESKRVAVAIVNWNRADDTLRCIKSVLESSYAEVVPIIVDNASTDGSYQHIRSAHPDLEMIRTGSNLGYAGGNNVAIRRAMELNAEYVFILNNDTAVPPDCIRRLVQTLEADEAVAQVGPLVLDAAAECVGSVGGEIHWANAEPRLTGHRERNHGQYTEITEVGYVPGSAVLVRSQAIREAGVLPEHYFLYFEDVAWSLRFQAKGWKTIVDPTTQVLHWESSSAGRDSPLKLYYYVRNNCYFIEEWSPPGTRHATWIRFYYKLFRMTVKRTLQRKFRHVKALLLGYLDYQWGSQGRMERSF